MKKSNLKSVFFLVNILFASTFISAQTKMNNISTAKKLKSQQWEVGLLGGLMQYNGELNSFGTKENNIGLGGMARYHFNNMAALRINFLAGKLTGNDANNTANPARNVNFKAGTRELALLAEIDILGNRRYSEGFRRMISPYIFGGIAATSIAPDVYYFNGTNSDKTKLEQDRSATFKKINLALPIGAGLKLDISEKWTFSVEAGYRLLFSDHVDGVSLLGNPENNDSYAFAGAVLGYRIPVVFDTDGDGVKDSEDICPTLKGSKRTKGCPDSDGDGVFDQNDKCPNEKGTAESKGCPDADGDGVADKEDKCPSDKGTAKTNGCPDTDGDGVADQDDRCPSAAGTLANKGCPDSDNDGIVDLDDPCPTERGTAESGCPEKDTDGDGIADSKDTCPNVKGDGANGCPSDTDNDGVLDSKDACPAVAGSARTNGCPDRDGDGIEDMKDACPDLAGTSSKGCPPVTEKDQKVLQSAIYGVQFESGTERLKNVSYDILDNIFEVMQRNASYTLEMRGHTDNVGDDEGNQRLSEGRANACFNYLLAKGISPARMNAIGFGETQPVSDNETSTGRAKNRRVEFELK